MANAVAGRDRRRPDDRADAWLIDLLARRADALRAWEPLARVDAPDAVHKMRVTVRQLRSDLRTFASLIEPGSTAHLHAELGWLADALGAVRDAEVLRARLAALGGTAGSDLIQSEAARRLTDTLSMRHSTARDVLVTEFAEARCAKLLGSVQALPRSIAITCGRASIDDAARPCVARAFTRLARKADDALRAPPVERPGRLHATRRAAKRLRYGAEAIGSVYGEPATELAARAEALQDVLGEGQDARVSLGLLLDLAAQERAAGRDPTALGVLAGLEEATARRAFERFEPLWAEMSRKRHRRWLRA